MVDEGEIYDILRKIEKNYTLRKQFLHLLEEALKEPSFRRVLRELMQEASS